MVSTRESSKPPPGIPPRRSSRERRVPPPTSSSLSSAPTAARSITTGRSGKAAKVVKPIKSSARILENQKLEKKRSSKAVPKVLADPITGETVWVANATVSDLKLAQKKHRPPWLQSKRYLVTVPSPQHRQIVYDRAAQALAELETRVLPPYGQRPWQCIVTFKEGASTSSTATAATKATKKAASGKVASSPYFCWDKRGRLELAAFPHLVEKMPPTPRFPGYTNCTTTVKKPKSSSGKKPSPQQRQQQDKQSSKDVVLDESEAVRISHTQSVTLNSSDDNAASQADIIAMSEVPSDDTPDTKLSSVPDEKSEASNNEVSVEESEDEEEEEEEEILSDELLDLYDLQERQVSGLSMLAWELRHRVPVPTITYKWISPLRQSFLSRKAAWAHAIQLCQHEVLLDKVLTGVGAHGKPIKVSAQPKQTVFKAGKLRFERDGLWIVGQEETWCRERVAMEQEKEEAESDTRPCSTTSLPPPEQIVPAALVVSGVGETKVRRLTGLSYFIQCRRRDHHRRRIQELKQQRSTSNIPPTVVIVTPAAVANETNQTPGAVLPATSSDVVSAITPTTPSVGMSDAERVAQSTPTNNAITPKVLFSVRDAEKELRAIWKSLPETEVQHWTKLAKEEQAKIDEGQRHADANEVSTAARNENADTSSSISVNVPASKPESSELELDVYEAGKRPHKECKGSVVSASPTPSIGSSAGHTCTLEVPLLCEHLETKSPSETSQCGSSSLKPIVSTKLTDDATKKHGDLTRSLKWCLNTDQIKKCYDAGMEHYDQIMRTVTARDLTQELQDGFDLLRERGKGRWDMTIPEWDGPEYWFLNDTKKAPWMPIVKEILGKDAVLIHKGMFLSMPGSSKQGYHQDGPHLTTQYQKPCHAINVFVPLVDITLENGPTEFCLGSHILGHEEFNDKFLYVPTVAAGTPIIFDYRLGHRGLGNTSTTCRPIVYCTYAAAADGKEFRDSVNFSRKRYHRIGELVEKGLTREQRAEKRKRSIEEQQLEEAIAASTMLQQLEDNLSQPARQKMKRELDDSRTAVKHDIRDQVVESPTRVLEVID